MSKYPLYETPEHEFASIEFKIEHYNFIGIKSVNYSHKMEPGKVYGTHPKPISRTRGQYLAEGDCEMLKDESATLRDKLAAKTGDPDGHGYGEVTFTGIIHYITPGKRTITDTLLGCRLKGEEMSNSAGVDALYEKIPLDIMEILRDGRRFYKKRLSGAAVAGR